MTLSVETVPPVTERLRVMFLFVYMTWPEPVVTLLRVDPVIAITELVLVNTIVFAWLPGSRASIKRVFASVKRVATTDGTPPALMRSRSFVKVDSLVSVIAMAVLHVFVRELLESNS